MRSLARGERIPVRNKHATRPWQHVLEPLSGYLHLAAELSRALEHERFDRLQEICSPFNFGPPITSNRTVEQLVVELLKHWPGSWEEFEDPNAKHEAGLLNLTIDKAYHTLGWQPRWSFEEAVKQTVDWYRQSNDLRRPDAAFLRALTQRQILAYADGWNYSRDLSRDVERVAL
jgi:CDP-glucose 4,6-dehydratase